MEEAMDYEESMDEKMELESPGTEWNMLASKNGHLA